MRARDKTRLGQRLGSLSPVALLLGACGTIDEGEATAATVVEWRRPTACVDCDVYLVPGSDTPAPPTSRINAWPGSLMFYGDASSPEGLAPQEVVIENDTFDPVELTYAYVVDAPDGGAGSAAYFSVELPAALESKPLLRGESAALTVEFLRSYVQRKAILVIETSHVAFASLEVDLAGKYFTNNW